MKSTSQSPNKIRIGCVDDHALFRQGLMALLDDVEDFELVFEASNGNEAISRYKKHPVDIVLMDIEMPIMNGIEASVELKAISPEVKILALTMHNEKELVLHILEKGINGFLNKDSRFETIEAAIRKVYENDFYFDESVSKLLLNNLIDNSKKRESELLSSISEKEITLIQLLCQERTSKEIATLMNLSIRTIEGYRKDIFKKTGVKNLVGLIQFALKHRIIEPFEE